ncbi:hypothetical protein D3C87_35070 [compost metagenome]
MDIRNLVEQSQGVIYHELGHLIGYILADKNPVTTLGNVAKFEVGIKINRVLPKTTLYHFENSSEEWDRVFENTKNYERTLAWFIEVVSGCTMQSLFENCDFNDCFGYEPKIGSVDYANICAIQGILSFEFTFDLIYSLQEEIKNLFIKYDLLEKLKPVVSNVKEYIINSSDHQVYLEEQELSQLIDTVDNLLEFPFVGEYFNIIKKNSNNLNPAS